MLSTDARAYIFPADSAIGGRRRDEIRDGVEGILKLELVKSKGQEILYDLTGNGNGGTWLVRAPPKASEECGT